MKASDVSELDILNACRAFHEEGAASPESALSDRFPPKVILAKMEKLEKRGLIGCGVSLRTAWLTSAGCEMLRQLEGKAP